MERIQDIWRSYRSMPLWVQVWVFGILVPVNIAAIFFIGHPGGIMVALLAIGGMTPNAFFLWIERGFSKVMALSHVVLWVPLVFLIVDLMRAGAVQGGFMTYLWILLAVDLFSLLFDFVDSLKWLRGDRDIAR